MTQAQTGIINLLLPKTYASKSTKHGELNLATNMTQYRIKVPKVTNIVFANTFKTPFGNIALL